MANNAEKSLHPAAYLNFRKEEIFSRWVAVWFDFHSQLLSRFSPQLLLWYFYTSSYTPFSKSMCFLKIWPNYCSFGVQNKIAIFFSDKIFTIYSHGCQMEKEKEKTLPLLSTLCPSFSLLNLLFWFLHAQANSQACHMRILKMKLSFRSHIVVIYTQSFNLNHYCIPSFSFYNNPLNAFKYGEGIATCRSKWNPDDL